MSKHTPTPWQPQLHPPPQKPRIHGHHDTTLICEIGNAEDAFLVCDEWDANAARIVACVNAFHSPDGREIATEKISEGLVWEMVGALEAINEWLMEAYTDDDADNSAWREDFRKALKLTRALLAKLEE